MHLNDDDNCLLSYDYNWTRSHCDDDADDVNDATAAAASTDGCFYYNRLYL